MSLRLPRAPSGNGATPVAAAASSTAASAPGPGSELDPSSQPARPPPGDAELADALRRVRLGALLDRNGSGDAGNGHSGAAGLNGSSNSAAGGGGGGGGARGLDATADWASMLSLGEQQRLAFARVCLPLKKCCCLDSCADWASMLLLSGSNAGRQNSGLCLAGSGQDSIAVRASMLSLCKQKRLAFARCVCMDMM